jgi:hypothetical protein
MEDRTEEWNDAERRRLDALAGEQEPPAHLEESVVAALKATGAIASSGGVLRKSFSGPWRAASLAAAIVVAFVFGRASRPASGGRASGPRFALFLYEGPQFERGSEGDRVVEYRAWAQGLRASGVEILGERLGERAFAVTAAGGREAARAPDPGERLAGYFVVAAPHWDDALAIARTCPHARHGGTIVVRPIASS